MDTNISTKQNLNVAAEFTPNTQQTRTHITSPDINSAP